MGFAFTWTPGTAGNYVTIAVSQPVSGGVRFMKTFWQFLGTAGYEDAAVGTKSNAVGLYAAQFGTPVVGQTIFVKLTPVSVGGVTGTPIIFSTQVVA
jgi:hypothetical protein